MKDYNKNKYVSIYNNPILIILHLVIFPIYTHILIMTLNLD